MRTGADNVVVGAGIEVIMSGFRLGPIILVTGADTVVVGVRIL